MISCILYPKFEDSHQPLLIVISVSFGGWLYSIPSFKPILPATRDVVGKVEPLACRMINFSNTELFHGGWFMTEILSMDMRVIL